MNDLFVTSYFIEHSSHFLCSCYFLLFCDHSLEIILYFATGVSVNGVLGASPSCHFVLDKYSDFWNSVVISLVWLVLCSFG